MSERVLIIEDDPEIAFSNVRFSNVRATK